MCCHVLVKDRVKLSLKSTDCRFLLARLRHVDPIPRSVAGFFLGGEGEGDEYNSVLLVPVAARSKAYVCGRSPAEIVGSNPTGGVDVLSVSVVCFQVEVSAMS